MSDLNRSTVIAGVVLGLALGAVAAWWSRAPDDARAKRAAPEKRVEPTDAVEKPSALYKWQDDSGVWTYTDKPPSDRSYELIQGTPNVTPVPTVVPEVPGGNRANEADTIPPPSN
jgi:Domain of unknown function (DUF4124)